MFDTYLTNIELIPYHSEGISLPSQLSEDQLNYLTTRFKNSMNFIVKHRPKLFIFNGSPWYVLLIKHRLIYYYEKVPGCWGRRDANGKLNRVYEIFKVNKANPDHNKKEWKDLIKNLDYNIVDAMKDFAKKYEILFNQYPSICKTIIETVYPKYLQKEIKNIEKSSKYKKGRYPKLERVVDKDTLVFRDSTTIQ